MARTAAFKNILRLIDAETDNALPHESFLSDLKRSIELDDTKNSRSPSKTYKPSSMNCMRASYYQIKGVEQDEGSANYTLIGICNSGTDIHQRIQQAVINMKSNNMSCDYINVADFVRTRELSDIKIIEEPNFELGNFETKLYHEKYNISFLCDGIIKYKNKYYILEIKTEASYKFLSRKSVDPKHHTQAITYSLALGLDDVIFLYISRDILDMKSFCFHVTEDMRKEVISYISECDSYLAKDMLPPKPVVVDNRVCQYCDYRTQCRKDG